MELMHHFVQKTNSFSKDFYSQGPVANRRNFRSVSVLGRMNGNILSMDTALYTGFCRSNAVRGQGFGAKETRNVRRSLPKRLLALLVHPHMSYSGHIK